nr:DUF1254 domain-containing protein [Luteibacter rhizovicinus]
MLAKMLVVPLILMAVTPSVEAAQPNLRPEEARAIARDAYTYGFPMVDGYRIIYAYSVDRDGHEFKAPWNQIGSTAAVYTPADKAVQTPNSDTPYSSAALDLRAEPLVLTLPTVEKNRYISVQLIDLYTHNFAYLGSRTTGQEGGSFLIAGPDWKGSKPAGIKDVIRSETQLNLLVFRTQLLNPRDIDAVKKVQAGYRIQPLSAFLGAPPPPAAPAIAFVKPLSPAEEKSSLGFFNELNFILAFCPIQPSERDLRDRFAKLGIAPGKPFDEATLSPELRQAVRDGMSDAWKAFAEFKKTKIDTGQITSADMFGTRAYLKNNYLYRMAAAVLGIYGNSKEEAMYPLYTVDGAGAPLDGSKNNYTLKFAPGNLPPAKAFWSLTMYELPSSLLSENPLGRYLINSPMLPHLKKDADGGVTLYLQHDSPGKDKEENWLPAPNGPFMAVLRLYWPDQSALSGAWKHPSLDAAVK